jgi:predicted RNA-binding Zn-ribbon protein involved in translation (DUF1610 family)
VSDRKYRQRGYQDRGDEKRQNSEKSPGKPANRDNTFGPRPLNMPASTAVSRCSQCGVLLASVNEPVGQCPKCGFELHSCKQCSYFEPAERFECNQPITVRIPRKDARNDCALYSTSVRVEKQTSTPVQARPMDARQAFENLFKK